MIKGFRNWVTVALLVAVLVSLFVFPFAIVEDSTLSAFATMMKYRNLHWSFNFFWFVCLFVVVNFVVLYFANKKVHGKLYMYLSFLCCGGMAVSIGVLAFLQSFLDSHSNIGINDHAGAGFAVCLLFALLFFLQMTRWYEHTEETIRDLITTNELNEFLTGKTIVYEDTVLLNPTFLTTIKHPNPFRLVATETEFVIGSQPITILPFKKIAKVSFHSVWNVNISIFIDDGRCIKLMWGPVEKYEPYSVMATSHLSDNLREILKKYK